MSKLKDSKSKHHIALIGTFIFFLLLFNAPFLHLPSGNIAGVPSLIYYIGVLWVVLILLMLVINFIRKTD